MIENLPLRFVIFGGTGDLVRKKIIPSIFELYKNKFLQENFEIIGVSRKNLSDEEFQDWVNGALGEFDGKKDFVEKCGYFSADISNKETLSSLAKKLNEQNGNNLYYLAISPNLYENAFNNIATSGLMNPNNGWDRILVEKPFGNDSEHAIYLDALLGKLFKEDQIFRIDHYLGKETLQNILTFRFANSIFEQIWNSDSIEEIIVEMNESIDVDTRGAFYDSVGALRDVGQNHVLQMLSLVVMEDPKSLNVADIRKARADALSALEVDIENMQVKEPQRLIDHPRAQYISYNQIPGINPQSETETFFSVKAKINNLRWKGTKINLISGKALNESYAQITVIFKEKFTSVCPPDDKREYKNIVTFKLQPKQEIKIQFWSKKPGFDYKVESQELSFDYLNEKSRIPDAYEKVLFDAIRGDQTMFISTKEILAQWLFVEKVIKSWENTPIFKYQKGIDPKEIISTI